MSKLFSSRVIFDAIKLSRINNLAIILFTQYFCALFLIDNMGDWQDTLMDLKLLLMVISTVTIAAAGYYINDYYDIKIDLINKPEQVIVGTAIKRRPVLLAHLFMNLAAIGIGAFVSIWIGLINLGAAFLLWLYSNQLKRMPFIGNVVVGILTGATLLMVSVYYERNHFLVFIYAFFAAFLTLIREIIKDMEDIKGDAAFGSDTLPIKIGLRNTKMVLYGLMLVFTLLLCFFTIKIGILGLYIYFACMSVPFLIFTYRLSIADRKAQYSNLSKFCKWLMLSGVVSMAFLIK